MSKLSRPRTSVKRVPRKSKIPAPVALPIGPYFRPRYRSLGDLARSGYDFSIEGMIDRMGY